MKMKYKNIVIRKTRKSYRCYTPIKRNFIGYFFEMGGRWLFCDTVGGGDCDTQDAKKLSDRWNEIADFLSQLNREGKA